MSVHKDMTIAEAMMLNENVVTILMRAGMHCLQCPCSQAETLDEACMVHGINCDELLSQLNEFLAVQA